MSVPTGYRHTAADAPTTDPAGRAGAGWAALTQGLLLFVPLIVLGAAIGWPASLGDPAAVMLPRLVENAGAVRIGYLAYLAYSILFGLTMVLLLRLVEPHLSATARRIAVGFAVASVVARSLGIVRWLAPMPVLADDYAAATDDSQRYTVGVVYDALNSYGGTIGEALGVALFASVPLAVLAVGLLRSGTAPRWIGVGAAVSAAAVSLGGLDLLGVDLGLLTPVTVTVVQLWFLAAGLWLLRSARRR